MRRRFHRKAAKAQRIVEGFAYRVMEIQVFEHSREAGEELNTKDTKDTKDTKKARRTQR
ncbi:MAG: hypothetical protein WCR42_07635 [bacterium]